MKRLTAVAICMLATGCLLAQTSAKQKPQTTTVVTKTTTTTTTTAAGTKGHGGHTTRVSKDGPSVGGYLLDAHKHGIEDAHAFIYAPDSSIQASGYSDATGRYQTNAVLPGTYNVKVVYPNAKVVMVSGVVIKKAVTPLSISMDPPAADTTVPYSTFAPPPPDKKKGAAKKK